MYHKSDVKIFAQRLHQLMSGIKVNHTPVTVSIGITMTDRSHSLYDLTNQADGALYEATKNDRNKTAFYKET
jgi:GGDEF domain-containing protein